MCRFQCIVTVQYDYYTCMSSYATPLKKTRPVTGPGVWKCAGDTLIIRLTGAFHERRTREFWLGIRGPPFTQKKMNLRLAGMHFPVVSRGLTCTLQSLLSRYSITFSIFHPPYTTLTISMQIWTNHKTHMFKSGGTSLPDPPLVAPSVDNVINGI